MLHSPTDNARQTNGRVMWQKLKNLTIGKEKKIINCEPDKSTPRIFISEDGAAKKSKTKDKDASVSSKHLALPHHKGMSRSEQDINGLLQHQKGSSKKKLGRSVQSLFNPPTEGKANKLDINHAKSNPSSPVALRRNLSPSPSMSRRSLSPVPCEFFQGPPPRAPPAQRCISPWRECDDTYEKHILESENLLSAGPNIVDTPSPSPALAVPPAQSTNRVPMKRPPHPLQSLHIDLLTEFIAETATIANLGSSFKFRDKKAWWHKLLNAVKDVHGKAKAAELASQLMTDPAVLQEIQNKLSGMIGESSGYIKSLPKAVQRRIKALKKLQLEATMVEAEFHSEVHALECKYASRYSTINDKRRNIVGGAVEPTDEECEWPSSDEEEDDDEIPKITEIKEAGEEEPEAETKGISSFWCTAIKNVEMLSHLIEDYDEPILENMTDIRTVLSEKPMGFTLEFHFTPNDYFENTVLTKWYEMKSEPDDDEPFSFDGPLIVSSKGCDIKWKPGKDVTVGEKKMKQKNKKTGNSRTVTKKVPQKSFFNFFKPPVVDDDVEADDVEEHEEALLQADYEFGQFMRDSLVPQAVLWFTGEASQGDDEDDDEDYEGDEDDDEYDEEADGDYDPSADPNAGKECKQQ